MGLSLRPYQAEACERIFEEWEKVDRTLAVLPTGTGKTVIFASVVDQITRQGGQVLVLAHRDELLDQASDKIQRLTGQIAYKEKAESHTGQYSGIPVTVGSVQTLSRDSRLAELSPDRYTHIVVDEAHHALSNSYLKVLNYFSGAKVLGVTATPDRGDKKKLGEFFESQAYEYTMRRAIQQGYLCKVKAQMVPLQISLENAKVSMGDYTEASLGSALEPYLEMIADELVVRARGRKTVVFLPLIDTSQKFTAMLRERGMAAEEVHGTSANRPEILRDFDEGKFDVLCNSMLLTEGWDCPSVDCVVVLRPTKIRSLYQQMVGRGMRLSEGKDHLLILDFLWLTDRHDLCRPSALIAKSEDLAKRIDKMVEEDPDDVDILDAEEQAEKDAVAEREENLRRQLEEQRHKKAKMVDPMQYAFSIDAEDLTDYEPTFLWEKAPLTDKQKKALENRGINADNIPNAGMASMLIGRLLQRQQEGLSTPKQIRCLERFGFQRVGTWSFEAASKMITRLSINHWMLPHGVDPYTYKPEERA